MTSFENNPVHSDEKQDHCFSNKPPYKKFPCSKCKWNFMEENST